LLLLLLACWKLLVLLQFIVADLRILYTKIESFLGGAGPHVGSRCTE
jgi:hypothetical protein